MTMDEVYRTCYKTCYKTVYGYLFTLCKDKSLSEELTAETFFKAVQSYKNFDENCKVTTWLCQIAKNEYFNENRIVFESRCFFLFDTDGIIPPFSEFDYLNFTLEKNAAYDKWIVTNYGQG